MTEKQKMKLIAERFASKVVEVYEPEEHYGEGVALKHYGETFGVYCVTIGCSDINFSYGSARRAKIAIDECAWVSLEDAKKIIACIDEAVEFVEKAERSLAQ